LEIVEHLKFEQTKRTKFTYEMGWTAEKQKAQTSLEREEEFVLEIRKLMKQ